MPLLFTRVAAALAAAMLFLEAAAAEARIDWTLDRVEVQGLSDAVLKSLRALEGQGRAEWEKVFSVQTEQPGLAIDFSAPAIAGAYEISSSALRFKPVFPLEPGVKYRAAFRPHRIPGGSGPLVASTFHLEPPKVEPTTKVAAIYPSAASIPENVLKFYLHFTAPMSAGRIYDHIHLKDAQGQAVELPFLEIDEELWNPDMTRLTLFLDPGRIKRGVKPLEDIGPSFRPGGEYTLEISTGWEDARGARLAEPFVRKFKVVEADRKTPDPDRWKISAPKPSSREALAISFDEPLDHGIASRTILVLDGAGAALAGKVELLKGEMEWRFVPETPWKRGAHRVRVPSLIEDLAGNNIGEAFDVDSSEGERKRVNRLIHLSFEIR